MGRITITIDTDNAAFEEEGGHEVARILRTVAQDFVHLEDPRDLDGKYIRDINGNRVGKIEVD